MEKASEHVRESPEVKIKKMDGFIRAFHAEQTRNGGKVPYWYHCKNVAQILSDALELSEELCISSHTYCTP